MTFCTESGCSRDIHALGLCRLHYRRIPLFCDHHGCSNRTAYLVTWPRPIKRREWTCSAHTQRIHATQIPSVIIERIGSK